jgi:choline-sulfatase
VSSAKDVPNRSLHRLAIAAACFLVPCFGCSQNSGVNDPARPVVVLVTLDTTRADHLGCYGSKVAGISPRIDELAASGVLFTSSISQAAVTPVSHASIFTGLYPYNHGLRVMHGVAQNRLVEEQVTLAEVLRDVGYDTGAFVSAFPVTRYFGFDQGFEHYDDDFSPKGAASQLLTSGGMVNTGDVQRHAGSTTDLALAWMEKREDPFFLWLHYFDPHDDKLLPPADVMAGKVLSSDHRERLKEIYDIEISYMDAQLGRVFDQLKAMGLWDNCIVVVTADHGEGLGDHNWWTHGVLYQEQIRVPLIVRAPGMPESRRVDSVVRSIDILPTVAALLGLQEEDLPKQDGVSLRPLLDGTSDDLHLSAYSDSVNQMTYNFSLEIVDKKNDRLFALVLDGRWKYIRHLQNTEKSELYDLNNDPKELHNLASEKPELMRRAAEELRAVPFMPFEQLEIGHTPKEILDRLRTLGYVGSEVQVEGSDNQSSDK